MKKTHELVGKTVGEYEVIARIGRGGMGEVFEGLHPVIGKRVAIKTLLPHLSEDETLVQRFISEARAVNAIRHRGIVDIFGFGRLDDDTQYFVMEYLDGLAFDKIIASHAPMAAGEVVSLLDQIVDALGAAHAAGVIHRDIKPSNLYLVDTGHQEPYVKVLDFGIAKTDAINGKATPQTRASMVMGTPDYMAPEQLRGDPVGAATDFYALGCVAYEMLVGHSPYKGENPMGTMFAHIEQPVRSPRASNAEVPPQLDEVVVWMMQKDARARPTSAAQLLERLDALWPAVKGMPRPPRRGTTDPLKRLSRGGMPAVRAEPATPTRAAPPSLPQDTRPVQRTPAPREAANTVVSRPQEGVPRRRWPLFVGLGVASLCVTAGALWLVNRPRPPPVVELAAEPPAPPEAAPPSEPVAPPEVVAPSEPVASPSPEPVAAPAPAPQAAPVKPKPAGVTQAMLEARLQKVSAQLAQREKATGGEDRVLRQFLAKVKASVAAAKDESDRRRAWGELGELQGQLAP